MLSSGELSRAKTQRLVNAIGAYGVVGGLYTLAVQRGYSDMVDALEPLIGVLTGEVAAIQQIIAAERQTAQAMDATQTTLGRFFVRPAAEHAHAANDEGHAPSPDQPTPTVA